MTWHHRKKLRVYDTGYYHTTDEDKKKLLVDYRIGDTYIPKYRRKKH